MGRIVKIAVMLLCGLLLAACVPETGIREMFEKNVKAYNRMLRWQEVEGAGQLYMVPEGLEEYLATAGSMRKRGVTMADFRILSMEALPDKQRGSALVEFDYYLLPAYRLKTLIYKQEWVYQEQEDSGGWRVKSPLPAFD